MINEGELLNLLCRNSLHPRTGDAPCEDCRDDPGSGVVRVGVAATRRLLREIDPAHRACTKCGERKPLTADYFYRTKGVSSGLHAQCKDCVGRYQQEWRSRKPADQLDMSHYRRRTLRSYNLTVADFQALLDSQGGRCAICRSDEPRGAAWVVDHDHRCCPAKKSSCGKCVRGLLCVRCNVGVSFFDDDPDRLRAAAAYMRLNGISQP